MNLATYRREIAQAMTEAELQDAIINPGDKNGRNQGLAVAHGWKIYHTHDSRRSHPGWPDLALARNGRLLLIELKKQDGKVTPDQQAWLDELAAVMTLSGHVVQTGVWRPTDLLDGTIEEALQ